MNGGPDLLLYQQIGADASGMLGAPARAAGRCHRCGTLTVVWHHRAIVTSKFTGWDSQPYMMSGARSDGWCAPCAWLYKNAELRRKPTVVTLHGQAGFVDSAALAEVLQRPLGLNRAVSAPITGRKHVAPAMRWGAVACDSATVVWAGAEARFAANYLHFRRLGVSRTEMAADTPPWRVTTTHLDGLQALLSRWEAMRTWTATPVWDVAARWL